MFIVHLNMFFVYFFCIYTTFDECNNYHFAQIMKPEALAFGAYNYVAPVLKCR